MPVFFVKTGILIFFWKKSLENFIDMGIYIDIDIGRYKANSKMGRDKALEKIGWKNRIILEKKKPSSKMTFKAKSLLTTSRLPSSV